jgi:hypothetical protein
VEEGAGTSETEVVRAVARRCPVIKVRVGGRSGGGGAVGGARRGGAIGWRKSPRRGEGHASNEEEDGWVRTRMCGDEEDKAVESRAPPITQLIPR